MSNELHPKTVDLIVPTIRIPSLQKTGNVIRGPEAFGCFNTGTRPTILRDCEGNYLVGAENDVETLRSLRHSAAIRAMNHQPTMPINGFDGRSFHNGKRVAKCFKGRGAAIKMFLQLVSEQLYMNDRLREDMQFAAKQSQSSDPETAICGAMAMAEF